MFSSTLLQFISNDGFIWNLFLGPTTRLGRILTNPYLATYEVYNKFEWLFEMPNGFLHSVNVPPNTLQILYICLFYVCLGF
jgi:hypothetical protein